MDKENINKVNLNDNIYPEKSIGVDTKHYRIKNININFNNIKVVNNISKKCSSTTIESENDKYIRINTIKKKLDSYQNEEKTLKPFKNNNIESDYIRKKIKVSKTKSLLKIPKPGKNPVNDIKVMKKIIKGKSENNLEIRKKIRIMKIDSCTIEGKSFKQLYNQENFFMKENFLNKKEEFLIGICDGHGKHGKLISKYIVNLLPKLISNTSENEIVNSYLQMNKHIISENNKKFDCSLSGASCISLIISLEKIISINLGNNKAILARQENGLYNYVNLNRQHKPIEPDEKERILENNGDIGCLNENNIDKKIIFLKNSDIPGLSISRSFGDIIAHSVGVISEPEVKNFYFNGKEKFVILASNDFWEIIDAEESVKIVKEFYENDMDAIGALNQIANELLNKCENQQKSINDDITIIIVFFE
jgi:serine/threonine protein phosphatase PrpC